MCDRKETYCDRFIAKSWIIHLNLSTRMFLISFKTSVQGTMLLEQLYAMLSGFRSLHSVVTCLLKCTSDWYLDMDKGQYTAMIFVVSQQSI